MVQARLHLLKLFLVIFAFALLSRLFYWQIITSRYLSHAAQNQRSVDQQIDPERGQIRSNDGYALVSNQPKFTLFAYLPQIIDPPSSISSVLAPLLIDPHPQDATQAAKPYPLRIQETNQFLLTQLTRTDTTWVPLQRNLDKITQETITDLHLEGLGFDRHLDRLYPEASMSAHLLGFVGINEAGEPQGYFGLEGFYDRELRGRSGQITQETDAAGQPILIGLFNRQPARNGRNLIAHLDRSIQYQVETQLSQGIEKYGAKSGEIIVMDPFSGAILALAAFPSYDPDQFHLYDTNLYKNPLIANTYEPGSTFKVITMAAAIDAGVVEPDTVCDHTCNGPVAIGKYTIRTWNNQYNPDQTMTDVLARSDNTGMIFTAFKLGKDKFVDYITNFGFGQFTGIDLQEETSAHLRSNWGDIDLATASFGQGIAVTGIQMATAISAIANGGNLVVPHVIAVVEGDETTTIPPAIKYRVIASSTAQKITAMMETAAHHGEAQWAVLRDYRVAGKTGTAQIPIAGHYDQDKTIASFIGFAPVSHPKFVMLVKLTQPSSSPWASETAAPLWFDLAHQLLQYFNIPPDH